MRINSKSSAELNSQQRLGSRLPAPRKGLEKLSSGYLIGPANGGTVVLISQKLRGGRADRPQLIRSAGARPVARAS